MGNKNLNRAKKEKNDEFYTQLTENDKKILIKGKETYDRIFIKRKEISNENTTKASNY